MRINVLIVLVSTAKTEGQQMSGPMSPKDAAARKISKLPQEVFEVFDDLIAINLSSGSARVPQKDVVAALEKKGFTHDEIFTRHLLDVEPAYRDAGWQVTYDKPGYNESYGAYYVFTEKN